MKYQEKSLFTRSTDLKLSAYWTLLQAIKTIWASNLHRIYASNLDTTYWIHAKAGNTPCSVCL